MKRLLINILIIIGIVALGTLAINQFLGFRYKAQFLQAPCGLCRELNPHLNSCFDLESSAVKLENGTILYGQEAINYVQSKNNQVYQMNNFTIPDDLFLKP